MASAVNKKTTKPSSSKRSSVPKSQCTHVTMNRLHGNFRCEVCDHVPKLGWLYICDQDLPIEVEQKSLGASSITSEIKDWNIRELELLGFNQSVINAAEDGQYDDLQVLKLKDQKRHVKAIIDQTEHQYEILRSKNGPQPSLLAEKLAALADNAPNSNKNNASRDNAKRRKRTKSETKTPSRCSFKVCQSCRPSCKDRVFLSIEAVVYGEIPRPSEWTVESMPVRDVQILRNIALHEERNSVPVTQCPKTDGIGITKIDKTYDHAIHPGLHVHQTRPPADSIDILGTPFATNIEHETTDSRGFRLSIRKALDRMIRWNSETNSDVVLQDLISSESNRSPSTREEKLETLLYRSLSETLLVEAASTELPVSDSGLEDPEDQVERCNLVERNHAS